MRFQSAITPLLAGMLLVMTTAVEAQQRAASVLVESVETRAIADTTPTLGQLVASTQADVATRRSGVTDEVLFEIGDRVEAGADLVRLDTTLVEILKRSAQADLAIAEAGILTAEARVALAEQALARQERLKGSTAFRQGIFEDLVQSVEEARGELAEAAAQLTAAEARMAQVEYDLENSTIRAPFTGIVVQRMAQPGQYASLGDPVAKLLDIAGLEIEADVPVELIAGLKVGTEVAIRPGHGEGGKAIVRVLLPVETVSTRTRPVRFSVKLDELDPILLAIGSTLTLEIPISAPRDAITVPKDALVQARGGGWMVFVVEEEVAQPRNVTLGGSVGDRLEVLSGLIPGDLVVVRGNERLRPGQTVNASKAGG